MAIQDHLALFHHIAATGIGGSCGDPWQHASTFSAGTSTTGSVRNVSCGDGACGTNVTVTCQPNGGWSNGCVRCSPLGPELQVSTDLNRHKFFHMTYDTQNLGFISTGGSNGGPYANGNYYHFNACTLGQYSTDWTQQTVVCGAAQLEYYITQDNHAMWLFAPNLTSATTLTISGRLTSTTTWVRSTAQYQYPKGTVHLPQFLGLRKSLCGGVGYAGVHHLFVTNDHRAPQTWAFGAGNVDDDAMTVRPGSTILAVTYWSAKSVQAGILHELCL